MAKRYGWTYKTIAEDMYWEDVYEFYEYACNLDTLEKNDEMKFHFMIHAQSKKAINSWKDLPIPFPARRMFNSVSNMQNQTSSGDGQISGHQKTLSKYARRQFSASKMSESQRKRRDYVARRQKEHQQKMQRLQYGNY